jgi:hypothetical protein
MLRKAGSRSISSTIKNLRGLDWLQAKEIIMPADPKSKLKVEPDWPAANSSPPINQKTAKRKIEAPQVIDTDTDIESLHEEARISTAKARLAVANAELALAEIEVSARFATAVICHIYSLVLILN